MSEDWVHPRDAKNPVEFERRLGNFIKKTTQGKMFGNWNDVGRLT